MQVAEQLLALDVIFIYLSRANKSKRRRVERREAAQRNICCCNMYVAVMQLHWKIIALAHRSNEAAHTLQLQQ